MTARLIHRGPDDEGYFIEGPVGLGMRRLAILDLTSGRQPMASEDGTVQVVFNGEIYNFQELRRDLEGRGHRFRTRCDTEVLAHLYEEKKEEMVHDLVGMFAFAVWDGRLRRLLLARDRLGVKPLVYADTPAAFLFSSEMKALLVCPEISREVDPVALDAYLSLQYIPSPTTVFRSVRKLPPGCRLIYENGRARVERYWEPAFAPKWEEPEEALAERLRHLLSEATRIRLVSDVPLGAFLSGGVDSSSVVAFMASHSSQPVQTFSIGFEEEDFSELKFARIAARAYGCDHHEFILRPDAIGLLPRLAYFYGEPYADSSAIPTYYVSRETRRHVTVALNGDGGDESFAGYNRYLTLQIHRWFGLLPESLRRWMAGRMGAMGEFAGRTDPLGRLKRFLRTSAQDLLRKNSLTQAYFWPDHKEFLYTERFREILRPTDGLEFLETLYRQAGDSGWLDTVLYADLRGYLPECLLVKVDIASMAHSLEARSPYLDHRVVEFAARLPEDLKLRGLTRKYLLRRALKNILPDPILRRGKMGFGVPLAKWFRGELRDFIRRVLLSEKCLGRGYFRKEGVERLLAEHEAGRENHAYRIWALLFLETWFQVWMDRFPEGPPPEDAGLD